MRKFYQISVNQIGADIIKKAKDFAKSVVSETYDRFDYDQNRRAETIYIGKLAEESFSIFAKQELNIELYVNYDIYEGIENVDENDFNINGYEIDIKSSKDTKNEGIEKCFNYFNFPVPIDQEIKDITVSMLYDHSVKNFYIVSWIDKDTYSKNCKQKDLPVGYKNGKQILRTFYLYKLKEGFDYFSLIEKIKGRNN